MEHLVSIRDISKEFAGKTVVDRISFDVQKGEIMGILGPNGAGKSTIIRSIMGIIYPDSGTVQFASQHSKGIPHGKIGYLPEERGLYRNVKVIDILVYLSGLKGYPKDKARERSMAYLEKFDLKGKAYRKVEELSKGMAQKVQFIASVLHEPELLILDEPFSGLDPVSQDAFKAEIRVLAEQGTGILLSSHQMNLVEALCSRIFLIHQGKKVVWGELNAIKESFADFKCVIHGSNSRVDFSKIPMVERVEQDLVTTTLYFARDAKPGAVLAHLPMDVVIQEMYINRISLHDIFVSIATGGVQL